MVFLAALIVPAIVVAVNEVMTGVLFGPPGELGVPPSAFRSLPGPALPQVALHLIVGAVRPAPVRPPVEALGGRQGDLFAAGYGGIDFARRLGVGLDVETFGHDLLHRAHLVDRQIGRRAPAPVILHHLAPPPQTPRHLADFAMQVADVFHLNSVMLRDAHTATADAATIPPERPTQLTR